MDRGAWQGTAYGVAKSLAGYSLWGCKESDTTEHTCTGKRLLAVIIQKLPTSLNATVILPGEYVTDNIVCAQSFFD